ncbi:MAG: long-chain fatty acid--CoA ligase [Veillonellaceae bacterium]|nr:long-chain fatty acid--CoA ligase [Veillonellaceae bacterium]
MLVHQLIEQGKIEQIALFGKKTVTYGELQAQVGRYRAFFYQQGVRQGDNVGLLAKNSVEFIYSYMAIISLGAVAVPINFQLVPREIAYIIKDAKIKVFVTMTEFDLQAELANYGYHETVNQLVIPKFSVDLDTADLDAVAAVTNISADDSCVIIYTSGTTGNPKGAVLSHNNLVSDSEAFTKILSVNAEDNVLCVLPMYHCFSWTCAVLSTLLHGAAITILETFNPKETVSAIRDGGVTIIYAVPAMYQLISTVGRPEDFSKVRYFISGGASLPETIARNFQAKFGIPILEGYGLSEASPVVCLNRPGHIKYCSIGETLPGIDAKIVNEDNREVPTGEVGELIVRGPNVMKGYYNLPEDTAKALRNGWLHTGDMAYGDEDGYIFIVDRIKDMIITSGENVYPREIEELLYAHPAISEAAVIGIPDKLRGQAGRAYVVIAEGHTLDKKALREYLSNRLAAYKVPREFVQVEALPKNSTGKIMKRLLREEAV